MVVVAVVDAVDFFAWFSEKPCLLFIATCCEGSLSGALMASDLLPVGFVAVVVGGGGGGAVAVDVVAADGVVGVCAWLPLMLLLLFSLSSALSASLSSCWYISSTMGFHNRTLALMNQFDT